MLGDCIGRILNRVMEGSSSSSSRTSNNGRRSSRKVPPHQDDDEFVLSSSKAHWNNLVQGSSNNNLLNLVHQLYNLRQGDHTSTTAYLHAANHLADRLAAAGRPITLSEFNIFVLKGLRAEFSDLAVTLAARPRPISFAELHSLLVSHEFIHGHHHHHFSSNYSSDAAHVYVKPPDQKHNDYNKWSNKLVVDDPTNDDKRSGGISCHDFPHDFVFGTATSSYQFEGAAAEGGRGLGVWDVFTKETPDTTPDGTNGNVAVDMYHRYKEDVEMMKKMGFSACRISISWPRILPGGRCTAGVNREGINFYNHLINTMLANGIEPYVTLFHWDLPYCLEQEYGGFLSKQIVNDFREFVELCFWEFGDRVKSWITINEPWSYCISGYVTGVFPPGKPAAPSDKIGNNLTTYRAIHDPHLTVPTNHSYFKSNPTSDPAKDVYTVARNLLLAHSAAVHSYRTKFQEYQEGKIGIIVCCQWYEPFDENSEKDLAASERAMDFMLGWFLEPVLTGRYPDNMRNFVPDENLAQFSEEESRMLKGSTDFVGLNYYTANYVANDINPPNSEKAYYKDQQAAFHSEKNGELIGERAGSTWLYIVPWGVYKLLKRIKDKYKDIPPIYITENGVDEKYDPKLTATEVCADTMRVKYHQDHLAYILKAINEKVNVKGYFVWAYCDNFEWSEGYTVRFGLVFIDFMNSLTRYPKNSALWFTKFLHKRKQKETTNKINNKMSTDNVKFIKN